jgi:hypothetical protein
MLLQVSAVAALAANIEDHGQSRYYNDQNNSATLRLKTVLCAVVFFRSSSNNHSVFTAAHPG